MEELRAAIRPDTILLSAMAANGEIGVLQPLAENAIEHGLALCDGDTIDQQDLPISIGRTGQAEALREQWRQGERSFEETVVRFETEILRESLESHHWNQTRTANALGITRRACSGYSLQIFTNTQL